MRPPRLPTLSPTQQPHVFTRPIPFLSPRPPIRLSSTFPSPSLLKTHNIPAPHLGHIRVLSLNNPATRNAISRQLLSELSYEINTLKRTAEDEVAKRETGGAIGEGTRVLILASELDDCFCAGADLKERARMNRTETNTFLTTLRTTLTTLSLLPIPTISAISSLALGGGFELALSSTFRLLASSATVGLPETRLAIIPGAGGTYRLSRLIGKTRALEMILTGRRVGGWEALGMGICERVVDTQTQLPGWEGGKEWKREVREKVFEGAVGMAREICEGGPAGVGAGMRAVWGGTEEVEGREYEGLVGGWDRDEGLRAFGEKRGAVFRGR